MTQDARSRLLKSWLGVFCLLLLFALPIFLADTPYNDDNFRQLYGFGWKRSGRVFATIVMNVLDLRLRNLADLAPLGQILGLAALSYAGLRLARRLTHNDAPGPLALCLCAGPLAIQPYFLENLSYQYDALPMLLAQSCAALAVSLPRRWSTVRHISVGGLLVFAILSFYQPCLNTFLALCLVVFLADCRLDRPEPAWRALLLQIVAFALGCVPYHFLVAPHVYGAYEGPHAATIGIDALGVPALWANARQILPLLGVLLTGGARVLLPGFYLIGTAFAFTVAFLCARRRTLAGLTAGLVLVATPVLLLLLLSGLMLALKLPIYEPRTLTAFSVCVLFATLPFILPFTSLNSSPWRFVALLPGAYFLVLAFAYGNALHALGQSENVQITRYATILEDAGFERGDDLFVYGDERESPIVRNAETIFPILVRLLPHQGLHDDGFFGYVMLQADGIESREHTNTEWVAARPGADGTPLEDTPSYRLFRQNHRFCLVLKPR